jgi:Tol biopolymer transport system component
VSASADADAVELVSVTPGAVAGNESSFRPDLSGSGRFVAFASRADNLVEDDTNGVTDVFVRDRMLGTTERVSLGPAGAEADDDSVDPQISGSGRFVVFLSEAELLPSDANSAPDVYVYDRRDDVVELVSANRDGVAPGRGAMPLPSISPDGRFVAFASRAVSLTEDPNPGHQAVYLRDLEADSTVLVTVNRKGGAANHQSFAPSVSKGGQHVAFSTGATNLAGTRDANDASDVYVCRMASMHFELVSVGRAGAGDRDSLFGAISADGSAVAFTSAATNLVARDTDPNRDIYLRDLDADMTRLVSVRASGLAARRPSDRPSISPDGGWVAFTSEATLVPGETNDAPDAYLWGRGRGITWLSGGAVDVQPNDASYAFGVARDGAAAGMQSSSGFVTADANRPATDIYTWIP